MEPELPKAFKDTIRPVQELEQAHDGLVEVERSILAVKEYLGDNPIQGVAEATIVRAAEVHLQRTRVESEAKYREAHSVMRAKSVRPALNSPDFNEVLGDLLELDVTRRAVISFIGGIAAEHHDPMAPERDKGNIVDRINYLRDLAHSTVSGTISKHAKGKFLQFDDDSEAQTGYIKIRKTDEYRVGYVESQYVKIGKRIRVDTLTSKAVLVEELFPEFYTQDRPRAYAEFDRLMQEILEHDQLRFRDGQGRSSVIQSADLRPVQRAAGLPVTPQTMYQWKVVNEVHGRGSRQVIEQDGVQYECTWGQAYPYVGKHKTEQNDLDDDFDALEFTTDLIDMKIDEINENSDDDLLAQHCADLGELALGEDVYTAQERYDHLALEVGKAVDSDKDKSIEELMLQRVEDISNIVPELKPLLLRTAKEQLDKILAGRSNARVTYTDVARIERTRRYAGLLRVLDRPITNQRAIDILLEQNRAVEVDKQGYVVLPPSESKDLLDCMTILPTITAEKPRERLVEYFASHVGYPISRAGLTILAFATGGAKHRDLKRQQDIVNLMINPLQTNGMPTKLMLDKAGIYLQAGNARAVSGRDAPTPVLRSIKSEDYDPRMHVGMYTDGKHRYTWRPVSESFFRS